MSNSVVKRTLYNVEFCVQMLTTMLLLDAVKRQHQCHRIVRCKPYKRATRSAVTKMPVMAFFCNSLRFFARPDSCSTLPTVQ